MGIANRIYLSRARKDYYCDYCGLKILRNSLYIRFCSTLMRLGWVYAWSSGCDITHIDCFIREHKIKVDVKEFVEYLRELKKKLKWIEWSDITKKFEVSSYEQT